MAYFWIANNHSIEKMCSAIASVEKMEYLAPRWGWDAREGQQACFLPVCSRTDARCSGMLYQLLRDFEKGVLHTVQRQAIANEVWSSVRGSASYSYGNARYGGSKRARDKGLSRAPFVAHVHLELVLVAKDSPHLSAGREEYALTLLKQYLSLVVQQGRQWGDYAPMLTCRDCRAPGPQERRRDSDPAF
jgi:hypothetical protein